LHWAFHFKCLPPFIIPRNCKPGGQDYFIDADANAKADAI